MKLIELEKANSKNDTLYACFQEDEIRDIFDNGSIRIYVDFYKGPIDQADKLTDLLLTLSDEYILYTYNLTGKVSQESKIQAIIDAIKKVFVEGGIPYSNSSAMFKCSHPVIYTNKIDSTSIR